MIDKKCPICREVFTVPYPELWRYRKGSYESVKTTWFCSWGCLRKYEQQKEDKKMRQKVTLKQKEQAVRIALDGGDPIAYLDDFGVDGAQMWLAIRKKLREEKPEVFSQLPEGMQLGKSKKVITEEPKEDDETKGPINGPLKAEEKPKIFVPLQYDGMTVTEISGEFGGYRRVDTDDGAVMDFRASRRGDMYGKMRLALVQEQWGSFMAEIVKAAAILGIDLEAEMKKAR